MTTHWSVVLRARDKDSPDSAAAREKLCRTYWPSLYQFLRRQGHSPHDAQDLTQEFLSRFLQRDSLDHLKDQRGKFRSFLLTFLKHFLSEQRQRAGAQKRGGGQTMISLDACEAEERELAGLVDILTAEQLYERRWARTVMDEAVRRLGEEYAARGNAGLFGRLKELQPGERGEQSYADLAAQFGVTVQAVKSARHAINRRYAELIREEVAQTLADPAELEPELQHLMQIFSR